MEGWNRRWIAAAQGISEVIHGNYEKETEACGGGSEKPAIGITRVPEVDKGKYGGEVMIEEKNGLLMREDSPNMIHKNGTTLR